VIVRHGSRPYATNAANDPPTLPAFAAVAKELAGNAKLGPVSAARRRLDFFD
jgi:hypothetical protein